MGVLRAHEKEDLGCLSHVLRSALRRDDVALILEVCAAKLALYEAWCQDPLAGCYPETAHWCPRCGTCTCADPTWGLADHGCPLHDPEHSFHGAPRHPDYIGDDFVQLPSPLSCLQYDLQRALKTDPTHAIEIANIVRRLPRRWFPIIEYIEALRIAKGKAWFEWLIEHMEDQNTTLQGNGRNPEWLGDSTGGYMWKIFRTGQHALFEGEWPDLPEVS